VLNRFIEKHAWFVVRVFVFISYII